MLRDIIEIQHDLFALVEKYPELRDKPLITHSHGAIQGVMNLYDNSLIEALKTDKEAENFKRYLQQRSAKLQPVG